MKDKDILNMLFQTFSLGLLTRAKDLCDYVL